MKEIIEKHISNILITLQIELSFEVYNCIVDNLPEWTEQIQITHEYLICCGEIKEKDRLQKFIGKSILEFKKNYYWFEGDITLKFEGVKKEISNNKQNGKIDYLKTETRLPSYLDDFIFTQLNAEYAPDFQKFDYNLDLTKEDNKKYLGTYFPRSYAESFCIFDNVFQNVRFQETVFQKDSLNILSVGCGTGGDLIGLLTVIEKYCNSNMALKVWAIDGNNIALDTLTRIVEAFKKTSTIKINLNVLKLVFSTEIERNVLKDEIKESQYDFIVSSKMITELISAGKGVADNSYFHFMKTFLPLLSDNGLCLLLDVTTKQEHNNTYNPILMNAQINKVLLELGKYKTLLPLSCSLHETNCCALCFTQQQFTVSHSKHSNDVSKVAYRIIAKINFAEQLGNPDTNAKYLIGKDKICCHTENNNKKADSYLLVR